MDKLNIIEIGSGAARKSSSDPSVKRWVGDDGEAVKPTTAVTLGEFAVTNLAAAMGCESSLSRCVTQAVRYYLNDQDSGRAGWLFPDFLRGGDREPNRELSLVIDDGVWERLAAEAKRQRVSTDELVEHAVLYLTADRDSGRLTQRILDDFDREDET